ncbi:MAG: vitamin B12-dependent ribonucleotide reductase, partial [Planctomycetota bacterium]
EHGYRNAQATLLAPTGTIGFMMDCDTTGIEPDIALVKYKQLAGGGMFKMVNRTVPLALERLGYNRRQASEIIDYIDEHDTIEGAPHLAGEHLPVFDCAFQPANGSRCIHYMGHVRMMGAVQSFLSGAISKTVNMPKDATVEDITNVYLEGWNLGLKAVAIYRDGSKRTQPLNVSDGSKKRKDQSGQTVSIEQLETAKRTPHRHRLPATRPSLTHKFEVGGHEGYLNVGLYEDGSPGELFITMAKEGSTVGGMMDAFATAVSLCLQYGVPLEGLVKKFSHQRFDPSGMTSNRDIPFAKSIVDYIFRWLGITFLEDYRQANVPDRGENNEHNDQSAPEAVREDDSPSENEGADRADGKEADRPVGAMFEGSYLPGGSGGNGDGSRQQKQKKKAAAGAAAPSRVDQQFSHYQEDAPACDVCGSITVRNGNCYKCFNCGSSMGCS